jgi:tetratricopeptide (TPR) repeat protein
VPGATFEKIDGILRKARLPELRGVVAAANARRSWPFARGTLEWARLLDAQGAREEARTILRRHEWLAGFPDGAAALAQLWLELGDAAEARRLFVAALQQGGARPAPSVLAGLAKLHLRGKNLVAAQMLLRRAYADPSCHEADALVEYLVAAGDLPRWSEAAGELDLSASALHELKLALFAHFERKNDLSSALSVISHGDVPVSPGAAYSSATGQQQAITCERIRLLARRTGDFAGAAAFLEGLVETKAPDSASQLAALYADWAESGGDAAAALRHLEDAANLRPATWEFVRRCATSHLSRDEPAAAKKLVERFLTVSQVAGERDEALELWERANAAVAPGRQGG